MISPQQILDYMKTVDGDNVSKAELEKFMDDNHGISLHVSNTEISSLWSIGSEKFSGDLNMLNFILDSEFPGGESVKWIEIDFASNNNDPASYPVILEVLGYYLKRGYFLKYSNGMGAVRFELITK